MEQGSGYAGGDGDEVALAGEDFDVAGAGDVGEVDGASAADAGGGGLVGGDGGELREQFAGVDEERFEIGRNGSINFRNPRSLHCASLSLQERKARVGMTEFGIGVTEILGGTKPEICDFVEGVGVF